MDKWVGIFFIKIIKIAVVIHKNWKKTPKIMFLKNKFGLIHNQEKQDVLGSKELFSRTFGARRET